MKTCTRIECEQAQAGRLHAWFLENGFRVTVPQRFDKYWALEVLAPLHLVRASLPPMLRRGVVFSAQRGRDEDGARLARSLQDASAEVATWPDWRRKAYRVMEPATTEPKEVEMDSDAQWNAREALDDARTRCIAAGGSDAPGHTPCDRCMREALETAYRVGQIKREYITGHCYTTLAEWQGEEWPTLFCAVPRVGDRVSPASGRWLCVLSVTHNRGGGVHIELGKGPTLLDALRLDGCVK